MQKKELMSFLNPGNQLINKSWISPKTINIYQFLITVFNCFLIKTVFIVSTVFKYIEFCGIFFPADLVDLEDFF